MKDKVKVYAFAKEGRLVREEDGSFTVFDNLDAAQREAKEGERIVHLWLLTPSRLPR